MTNSSVRFFAIPLPGGRQVAIEGDFPLTEAEWDLFAGVLAAMKPGLIQEPAPKGQHPEGPS
jgi:hypothetical protein